MMTLERPYKMLAKLSLGGLIVSLFVAAIGLACGSGDDDGRRTTSCSLEDTFASISPSVVRVTTDIGVGTGFVVGDEQIITNQHVIEFSDEISVELDDGTDVAADVIGSSIQRDLALLRADTADLAPLGVVSSSDVQPGREVFAVGFAAGLQGPPTISEGILSARRNVEGFSFLQTTASINPGNSGGPLIDACGNVIGITTAKISESEGLGLAVPGEDFLQVFDSLVAGGDAGGDDSGDDGYTCGDDTSEDSDNDGGDSEYYNELESILDDADQKTAAIGQQYGGPYDDTADEIDQTTSAFEETGSVLEDVAVTMSDLDPPADAGDAHDAYVVSLRCAAALFATSVSELGGVTTAGELTAFQGERGPDLNAAVDDIEVNCLVLQGLADDAGSDADLGCSVQD